MLARPMPTVHRLSEALANQIAAGEVVERPAAAVKELVENALDAGAGRVEVRLVDGGRRRLEVVDDGSGMGREDALLALERHTTSKLSLAADLFDLRTFGFRGEALPSIASVSRMTLTTRPAGAVAATRIRIEGGKVLAVEEAGAPPGTRVEVDDLFFNVPARLKFLKSRATEQGHVVDWVSHLALANPEVAFSVSESGRALFKAERAGELKERIAAVLGRELFEGLHRLDARVGEVFLTGYCAGPGRQNATSREIFTFVNGRYVREKSLLAAVARAYEGVLQVGRSPAAVLFIEVPPGKVDVNVHPQKLEVRFSEPREVFEAVFRSVRDLLAGSPWLSKAPARTYALRPSPAAQQRSDSGTEELSSPPRPIAPPHSAPQEPSWVPRQERIAGALSRWATRQGQRESPDERPLIARDSATDPPNPPPVEPGQEQGESGPVLRLAELRYLGQVHRTYLVLEAPEGLVLLDQHAAHERVLYERFRAERAGEAKEGVPLLVPRTLEFSAADARLIESALDELRDLGFDLEPFGGSTFSLTAVPAALEGADANRLLRQLAQELRQTGTPSAADRLEEALLARMACHAAVRAGDALSPEEAKALLVTLDGTPFHAQCPHGRPVVVRFDAARLEELFQRKYPGTPKAAGRDRVERS